MFGTCNVSLWLDPPLTTVQCVMYSGFVDDDMFSHNEVNGPELETTLFRRVRQMPALGTQLLYTIRGLLLAKFL